MALNAPPPPPPWIRQKVTVRGSKRRLRSRIAGLMRGITETVECGPDVVRRRSFRDQRVEASRPAVRRRVPLESTVNRVVSVA